ncbi:MAG: hypothetical protein LBI38_01205 [Oscillospiraceae bacterium]|jgi:DNA repair protein RadC|nr:hypothetical protein [Oscillospiraceae bacterium]
MTDENKNPRHNHHGHRQRKKAQFLENGLKGLPEHEVLEFLLYYAIPYRDTNGTAHALIEKYGSLANVMNADYNELVKINGVGANAASLICFSRMLAETYLKKKAGGELLELFNSERLKNYCSSLFVSARNEEIHCLYLTDNLKLIFSEMVCSGTVGSVELPVRDIARAVFANDCSRLVIAHNHPAGSCMPSRADVEATGEILDVFRKMDVELIDHIIVGRDGVTSLRENGYMNDKWL